MLISNVDTFCCISKNCLYVDSAPDGIIFGRFTKKQYQSYEANQAALIRSMCPSGVCLDFYTDSDYIRLEYVVRDIARKWVFFDIYMNDIFIESLGGDIESKCFDSIYITVPKSGTGLNRITIYLPHLVDIAVKNMELSNGAIYKKAPEYAGNLLCLGDSITQGMDSFHPSSTYPVQLSRFFKMNLINQGVGGQIFNKINLDRDIPYKPDIITVAFGTNDWNVCKSIDEFKQNCSEYINLLVEIFNRAKIYILTPLWRSDIYTVKPAGSFRGLSCSIQDICRNYQNISVINGMELVPNIPGYFKGGSVHPNDEGFLHYSINLIKYIEFLNTDISFKSL